MTRHIGIIGCSYEGAALCYRTICNEGSIYLGQHSHPEVTLHTHPLSEYMKFIETGDWNGVADLMISSAHKLIKAGAQILVCPDNTIHQSYSLVSEKVSVPFLHIAEEVAAEAYKKYFRKTLLLGTKFLMEGPVYPEKLSVKHISYKVPEEDQRVRINNIIFNELVYGVINPESKKYFLDIIEESKLKGCDSVILGCTEIPLIVIPGESPLPVLDSTRILARAALKKAIE